VLLGDGAQGAHPLTARFQLRLQALQVGLQGLALATPVAQLRLALGERAVDRHGLLLEQGDARGALRQLRVLVAHTRFAHRQLMCQLRQIALAHLRLGMQVRHQLLEHAAARAEGGE
jgi:hypothetical protein